MTQQAEQSGQTRQTLDLGIRGMTCASCVGRVERGLKKVEGMGEVVVNLATERATVQYDPGLTTPQGCISEFRGEQE